MLRCVLLSFLLLFANVFSNILSNTNSEGENFDVLLGNALDMTNSFEDDQTRDYSAGKQSHSFANDKNHKPETLIQKLSDTVLEGIQGAVEESILRNDLAKKNDDAVSLRPIYQMIVPNTFGQELSFHYPGPNQEHHMVEKDPVSLELEPEQLKHESGFLLLELGMQVQEQFSLPHEQQINPFEPSNPREDLSISVEQPNFSQQEQTIVPQGPTIQQEERNKLLKEPDILPHRPTILKKVTNHLPQEYTILQEDSKPSTNNTSSSENDYNKSINPTREDGWEDVWLELRSPRDGYVTITIGDRKLELRMVVAEGIVAPYAQLRRSPDAPPVPLKTRPSCHYSLYAYTDTNNHNADMNEHVDDKQESSVNAHENEDERKDRDVISVNNYKGNTWDTVELQVKSDSNPVSNKITANIPYSTDDYQGDYQGNDINKINGNTRENAFNTRERDYIIDETTLVDKVYDVNSEENNVNEFVESEYMQNDIGIGTEDDTYDSIYEDDVVTKNEYSDFEGTRIGSLSTCHPMGPHAMLMLDGHLIEVIPRHILHPSSVEIDIRAVDPPHFQDYPTINEMNAVTASSKLETQNLPDVQSLETESSGFINIGPSKDFQNNFSVDVDTSLPNYNFEQESMASNPQRFDDGPFEEPTYISDPDTFSHQNAVNAKIKENNSELDEELSFSYRQQNNLLDQQKLTSGGEIVSDQEFTAFSDSVQLDITWSSHLGKRQTYPPAPDLDLSLLPHSLESVMVDPVHPGMGGHMSKERERRTLSKRNKRKTKPPAGEEQEMRDDAEKTNNNTGMYKHAIKAKVLKKAFYNKRYTSTLTLEVALFLDAVLLKNLYSFYTEEQLIDLILSLVNNAQAFFHQKSLGRRVDLTVTQLYLLRTQPTDLPTHGGDRFKLLQSFCQYQRARVQGPPNNPHNWDIALYLSGIDLVSERETGEVSDVTMGLTYTGGVCDVERSCVISEFGSTNAFGRPFPSAGALASLILTHEIGHSLGLRHDGSNNTCVSQNYLMAAGRGPRGGTTWSSCSREAMFKQNGRCLQNAGRATIWDEASNGVLPGQRFDAVAQCQLFFRDHDATLTWPTNLMKLCSSVQCSSPHRLTSYLSGPALEGTFCGGKKWCREGKCVAWTKLDNVTVMVGGLGRWEQGPCTSACLAGGTGWRESRRPCNNPSSRNSDRGCLTTTYQTDFCDDRQVCGNGNRRDMRAVLAEMCSVVSERYHDALPVGNQLAHSSSEPWRACVLYCRLRSNSTQVWTPRYLFQDDPTVPTHLPPGAPCHKDPDGTNYRCFHRTCIANNEEYSDPLPRDVAGLFEYRDPPSLDDLVIVAGPPINDGLSNRDYPDFDLDDLF